MPKATLSPYEPSWRDRARWGLEDLLSGLGASRSTSQRYGDQLIGSPSSQGIPAADLVPWVSNAFAANEGKRAYDRGDWLGAGLGVLGAIPPIPMAKLGPDDLKAMIADIQANPMPMSAAQRAPNINPSRLPPPPRATMQPDRAARAAAQGYNLDRELYHGTPFDVGAFDVSRADPHAGQQAVFLTDQPRVAEKYASAGRFADERPNVMPLVSRAQNPFVVEDFNAYARALPSGEGSRFHRALGDIIARTRGGGHDIAEIRGMTDIGGYGAPQTQYAVPDPSVLRSRFAAFDPAKKGQNDLLAGIGGAAAVGAGAAATLAGGSEAQAGEMDDPFATIFAPAGKAPIGSAPSGTPTDGADPFAEIFAAPQASAKTEQPRSWGDTALGLAKAAGSGLEHLGTGLAGLPGYAGEQLLGGLGSMGLQLAGATPQERSAVQGRLPELAQRVMQSGNGQPFAPFSGTPQELNALVPGADYQPRGGLERVVQGATPFIAGAALAPGSLGQRAANVAKLGAVPYGASELAGKATHGVQVAGQPVEPAARFLAALVAPSAVQGAWQRLRTPFGEILPTREPALRTLQTELGGPVTPSSAHGGPILRSITDTLRNVPGGRGHADVEGDLARFETRALERAGVGAGAPPLPGGIRPNPVLPGEAPIPSQAEAFNRAYTRLENRYNLVPDARLAREVRAAAQRFDQVRPSTQVGSEAGTAVARILDQVEQAAATGAPISGQAFGALRKDIAARVQALRGSGGNDAAIRALRQQQQALMNGMGRSIRAVDPAEAGAWADITRRYAQYAPMRRAYGTDGITPQSYAQALKSGKNASAFAENRLPDAPFARAALEILPRGQQGITSGQMAKTQVTGAGYQSTPGSAAMFLMVPPVLSNVLMSPIVQRWWGAVDRAGNPVRVTQLPQGPERLPAILGALGSAVASGRDPVRPLMVEQGDKRQTRVRVMPEAMQR